MRKLKHLPLDQWPEADIEAFASVYEPGDVIRRDRRARGSPRGGLRAG